MRDEEGKVCVNIWSDALIERRLFALHESDCFSNHKIVLREVCNIDIILKLSAWSLLARHGDSITYQRLHRKQLLVASPCDARAKQVHSELVERVTHCVCDVLMSSLHFCNVVV